MPRARVLSASVVLGLALAACGGDQERTVTETVTAPPPSATTQVQPPPETPTTTEQTTTGAGDGACGRQGRYVVRIVAGQPSCEQARAAVAGYDPDGPKVQEVGAYTCEGAEAAVAPVSFTCVAGDNEVVAEAP